MRGNPNWTAEQRRRAEEEATGRDGWHNATTPPEMVNAGKVEAVDRELAHFKERAGAPRPVRLGCSTISHARLQFCMYCVPANDADGSMLELLGWRLLALREAALQ